MAVPMFQTFLNYESLASSFQNPNSRIAKLAVAGKPQQEFLYANIKEFQDSETYKNMIKAQAYYDNKNDIKDRKRYYTGRQGERFELEYLSNTKLSHPFITKIISQKVNYLLTNDFEISTEDDTYKDLLKINYFNKRFSRTLRNLIDHAILNGISWLQVYYDEEANLSFKRIPSEEVVPFWSDPDHTLLDAVIRHYTVVEYLQGGGKKEVLKVEFYDKQGIWYYIQSPNGLIPDPEKAVKDENGVQIPQAHFKVNGGVDEEGNATEQGVLWGKVPFVAFKYNAREKSILEWVKELIDDYDMVTSDLSNNIKDVPNSIKVIKGYQGTDKDQFSHNLCVFRTIFVGADGDVETIETPLDAQSVDIHVNRLRKDIHHFAAAVDTQETDLGNASGVAIKFRYADLDNDMSTLETQLQQAFEELTFFIDIDLVGKGKGDYSNTEFEIEFNKAGIINESELIADAKNSVGVISDETILAHHPWVTNVTEEANQLEKERKQTLSEDIEEATAMGKVNDQFGKANQKATK